MKLPEISRTNLVRFYAVSALVIGFFLSLLFFFSDTLEDAVTQAGSLRAAVGSFSALFSSILLLASQGVTSTISAIGYPGVFLLMLLESTSLPIPSEVILPFSGYLASLGTLNLWIVIFLSTAAGIAGSLVDYYLGAVAAKWGERKSLRGIRIGETILVKKVELWFNRYGSLAVFLTRMIPGARTLVSFPAGAARMKMSRFLTFTALGCFLWSAVLTYLGFFLGSRWSEILGTFHYLSIAILIAVGCTLFAWLALWATRFRRKS
ncbi:MAG TPA: DedA family protein [Nitrososphaerales archaeon]|nr:DedA family protein [Nitrososphaerales archaeon]